MKKIMAVLAMAALVTTGAFAFSLEASAGAAYGMTSLTTKTTVSDVTTTSKTTDNSWGAKAEATLGLTKDLGIQADAAFLWPSSYKTTVTYSNSDNVDSKEGTRTDSFVFNGFIGPVYSFNLSKAFTVKVGAGFDIAYNQYANTVAAVSVAGIVVTPETTYITSYMSYGLGATADATYMVNKNMGLKAGITVGYLWGQTYTTTTKTSSSSSSSTGTFDASGLYLIPDVSFVYKF